MLSPNQALEIAVMAKTSRHNLNEVLSSTVGTTFASMITVTDVALKGASKNAGIVIKKVVQSTVIVANNLKESTNLYQNKVLRTLDESNPNAENFVFSGSNYERTANDAYSVLSLRSNNEKKYLEAFPQSTQGVHYVRIENGNASLIYKAELEQYLTPSSWKKLNDDSGIVHNVKNDITHKAIYRAYKAESIHSMTINSETKLGEFYA